MKTLIVLGAIAVIALSLGSWFMGSYNGLVSQETQVDNSWATVETQYQRRFDLIPGIVGATKGALAQEQAVFGRIADARAHYASAPVGSPERVAAANQMESALARLLVVIENYPVLQSNSTVRALMDELAGTENRVQIARERYNGEVRTFNVKVRSFPGNIVAGMFGFEVRPFFDSADGADKAPKVDLTL